MCWGARQAVGNRVVYANDPEKNKLFATNAISNTKYNALTFVPYNLMEQFSRAMNRYFLIIACLQLVEEITPVNPLTTWLPLAVIFGVTAVKEGLDDLGRRRADNAANARRYTVVRDGRSTEVASKDIRVGDIVQLKANDEVPCDMVVVSTSDAKGNCFIQTTNLDGESNLKVRSALPSTAELKTPAALGGFKGVVECAQPNEHIYKFDSQLRMAPGGAVTALSSSQLLLQATHVRNTDWVYGMVVYSGNETKFGKNKKSPPTKYTKTDAFINSVSASVFALQLMLVIIFGIVGDVWNESSGVASWYLQIAALANSPGYQAVIIPARFLLLNSTMIPISLKLTIDLCKLAYAKYINADTHLIPPPEPGSGGGHGHGHGVAANPMRGSSAGAAAAAAAEPPPVGAVSNSTALSEDLGQVRYVLTDKTGTLTENKMVLQVCTILGTQFGRFDIDGRPDPGLNSAASGSMPASLVHAAGTGIMADMRLYEAACRDAAEGRISASALEFLRCLALNNDVVPSAGKDGGGPTYKASSPDEEALVKAAAAYGVALVEREGDNVTIECLRPDARESYTQLACFEFNSDRKRMSVILRHTASGRVRMYCKGADDMVMARLAAGQEASQRAMQAQIDAYAAAGLRTLVYAYRDLSEAEYGEFKASFDAASADMTDRDAAKERVYTTMEQNLVLIAASAIEDKLQDCVPETIALLKQAGIAFWMLTGDKFSTALTIAKTCNLKPSHNELIELEGDSPSSVKPSLDAAATRLAGMGYELRYEPIATGWSATASTLSLGFAGGRTTPLVPHRPPTIPRGAARNVDSASAAVSLNPLAMGGAAVVAAAAATTPPQQVFTAPARPDQLRPFTVIVRGDTLTSILGDDRLRTRFGSVCLSADSVICCRVTPKQKGQLVKLVKDAGHMTLAIGDGGNDVAMIQEAAVGVGIRGKEGLQASRASDYSVAFFRSLQRLLLVHGRYSYYRTCQVAQYSFYKSFYFCVMQIVFGFFSGYAGVSFFNSLCVAAYNVVVFVPIVLFDTDRDVSQATALALPEAYLMGAEGTLMTAGTMASWMLRGLWQAVVTMLLALLGGAYSKSGDIESLGLLVYFAYMWVQDLTMLFLLRRVNVYNLATIFGMHALAFGGMLAVNNFTFFSSFIDPGSFNNTVKDPFFWLTHALITVACVLPVEAWRLYRFAYSSDFAAHLQEADAMVERKFGAGPAAGAGGAGHAWKPDIMKMVVGSDGEPEPLGPWIRRGGRSRPAGMSDNPSSPLLKGGVGVPPGDGLSASGRAVTVLQSTGASGRALLAGASEVNSMYVNRAALKRGTMVSAAPASTVRKVLPALASGSGSEKLSLGADGVGSERGALPSYNARTFDSKQVEVR